MHYFKRNIGDYHKKAGRLSMIEHGAYTLLLDACYDRERFPTIEDAVEWSWARSDEEIAAVHFVLSKFFTLIDGFYVQQRVQDEIDAFRAKSMKNQEIAIAREAARRELRERNEHETCTDDHLTTNHKPITTNQEPKEDQEPLSTKSTRANRKTKIPDPFMLTADMRAWASDAAPAVNLKIETESFVDYWRGEAKTKADWPATWRNWIRRAQGDMSKPSRRGSSGAFNKQEAIEANNQRVVEEIEAQEAARKAGLGQQNGFDLGDSVVIDGEVIHAD